MGTSLGAAIDYLVSGTNPNTQTTLAGDLTAAVADAVLVDNFPTKSSESMVFIGRTDPDNAQSSNGSQAPIVLGVGNVDEEYSIPCYISVTRPGPAQKPSRDVAIALFDVVSHWLAADRTLGGAIRQGRYAYLSTVSIIQTRDELDAGDAGALRLTWITFDLHVRNHYTP